MKTQINSEDSVVVELDKREAKAILHSLIRTSANGDELTVSVELEDKLANFIQPQPIKFTVENKNGVNIHGNNIEINRTAGLIRIHRLEPIEENKNNDVNEIVNMFSIKGVEIRIDSYFNANGMPSIRDLPIVVFLNNTDDLKFQLSENSKIEVVLIFQKNSRVFRIDAHYDRVRLYRKQLVKGCIVFMKSSSGIKGYGNAQCISSVSAIGEEISLFGHNENYKESDIDRVVEYPLGYGKFPEIASEILEKTPCEHPAESRLPYHDQSILCEKCRCVISKCGIMLDKPIKL